MSPTEVHLVLAGEDDEGSTVVAVFLSKRQARAWLEAFAIERRLRKRDDDTYHDDGIMYAIIQTHEVRDGPIRL